MSLICFSFLQFSIKFPLDRGGKWIITGVWVWIFSESILRCCVCVVIFLYLFPRNLLFRHLFSFFSFPTTLFYYKNVQIKQRLIKNTITKLHHNIKFQQMNNEVLERIKNGIANKRVQRNCKFRVFTLQNLIFYCCYVNWPMPPILEVKFYHFVIRNVLKNNVRITFHDDEQKKYE